MIKDEILSFTLSTASIDPKCQSQDQNPFCVTHHKKEE